jgi:uncharacterized membrane protein
METNNLLKKSFLEIKRFIKKNNLVHKSFEIGILLKAIDGVLEVIGGFLLVFLDPIRLNKLTVLLTQHELSEDPKDVIARFMINFSATFSVSAQFFGVFYLISHGVVKLILVFLLWRKKLWAYPLTVVSLILFIMYQTYRYTIDHSMLLIVLTVFDLIMILLTLMEYKSMKNNITV